jgi:hypothetical protein
MKTIEATWKSLFMIPIETSERIKSAWWIYVEKPLEIQNNRKKGISITNDSITNEHSIQTKDKRIVDFSYILGCNTSYQTREIRN